MTSRLRWKIALLLSLAVAISYLDRQTLSVAIAAITRDIPISNTDFSRLQAAFLLAYALMYAGGGKLIDALGTRRGFILIMIGWSLACAMHGLATSVAFLAVCRFLLGAGEGGGFPAATKAVSEWFPVRERSTALGIINAGTAVGAVAAPPLIALILSALHWRWIFFFSGAMGLLWTLVWSRKYFIPSLHPKLSEEERAEIREVVDLATSPRSATQSESWFSLLAYPQVWGLVVGKFLGDAGWYFYLFWLPKYLYDVRGFDIKQVGYYAWIPYAASGVGCLVGGWISSEFLRRGHSVNFARKAALGISVSLMPLIYFVTHSPVELAIVLFSIAFFGQQFWSTIMMTLPADIFPSRSVGSVAGLEGLGGALGGVVFGLVVGYLLDHGFGYGVVFTIVSTFHVLAFLVVLVTIRDVRQVGERPASEVEA
jgi:ACS family hexuronate transporter-like MFS transporter